MYKTSNKLYFLSGILAVLLLYGCSADDTPVIPPGDTVPVRFEINSDSLAYTRAPGDAVLSVNRILLLPFKKTNESATNDAVNFVPDFNAAKQFDINSFPVVATMLNLSAASTYQVVAIGYNRNDFDFKNQNNPSRRFSIGPTASATMANLYLQPTNVTSVPEFFSCIGNGYQKNGTMVGRYFKPGDINYIQGNMKRIVSGMTLTINNIPGFVNSVSLSAENLVNTISPVDGTPLSAQTTGDGGTRLLDTKIPASNTVTFNRYMLATLDMYKSLFYLDVAYGLLTDRYTLKIADNSGIVSGNRITFTPNHWVRITGDYANINIGFTISDNVNLDDNLWDGIQTYN